MIDEENPENIIFSNLKLQFKPTQSDFEEINFKNIYEIKNLKTFWEVYKNTDFLTLIQHGSLFLSLRSPIWDPNNGTFSFIVSSISGKSIDTVWQDLSIFFLTQLLKDESSNIEGISATLKGRERNIFNLKITSTSKEFNSIDFSTLPSYFGNPKFLVNAERELVKDGFEMVAKRGGVYRGHRGRGQQNRGGRRGRGSRGGRGRGAKPPLIPVN